MAIRWGTAEKDSLSVVRVVVPETRLGALVSDNTNEQSMDYHGSESTITYNSYQESRFLDVFLCLPNPIGPSSLLHPSQPSRGQWVRNLRCSRGADVFVELAAMAPRLRGFNTIMPAALALAPAMLRGALKVKLGTNCINNGDLQEGWG